MSGKIIITRGQQEELDPIITWAKRLGGLECQDLVMSAYRMGRQHNIHADAPKDIDWPKGEPESVRVRYDSPRREGSLASSRVIPGEPGWSREGC